MMLWKLRPFGPGENRGTCVRKKKGKFCPFNAFQQCGEKRREREFTETGGQKQKLDWFLLTGKNRKDFTVGCLKKAESGGGGIKKKTKNTKRERRKMERDTSGEKKRFFRRSLTVKTGGGVNIRTGRPRFSCKDKNVKKKPTTQKETITEKARDLDPPIGERELR